ncbi:hypothetical protein [Sphingobacterium psychroaquaticum]|uniref:Uncharacterized protein n=1 Tax=Sphingobacterium psychroaquaticum TaxID=561061 RepID=A0A1X7JVT6_9SPHI|nr:hypothetical protein [Sphingobacterium psychroaquaticum]SMG32542.1 hypothetical protein SAMN05660862_2268 [Sphingobacterium psychroaquaticum]
MKNNLYKFTNEELKHINDLSCEIKNAMNNSDKGQIVKILTRIQIDDDKIQKVLLKIDA